ncbi:hypothetical protein [Erwinia amylovora]|uniref:hypothetical protein n=1 Tax=Erwinia amylovora TaxID=552 RepID=UPI0003A34DF9|nr:hypothetical protein [Erwinia amylovora]RUT15239.1 hypothetical protein BEI72_13155 [Erwinia amylovora]
MANLSCYFHLAGESPPDEMSTVLIKHGLFPPVFVRPPSLSCTYLYLMLLLAMRDIQGAHFSGKVKVAGCLAEQETRAWSKN